MQNNLYCWVIFGGPEIVLKNVTAQLNFYIISELAWPIITFEIIETSVKGPISSPPKKKGLLHLCVANLSHTDIFNCAALAQLSIIKERQVLKFFPSILCCPTLGTCFLTMKQHYMLCQGIWHWILGKSLLYPFHVMDQPHSCTTLRTIAWHDMWHLAFSMSHYDH